MTFSDWEVILHVLRFEEQDIGKSVGDLKIAQSAHVSFRKEEIAGLTTSLGAETRLHCSCPDMPHHNTKLC